MSKVLLTQAIVNDARCESGRKHTEICDLQVPGLLIYCTSSPTHVPKYLLRVKNDAGTNQFITLGSIRELTLSSARKLALQIKQERATRAKAEVAIPLLAAKTDMIWSTYIAEHFAPICRAHLRSAKKYSQLDRIYVAPRFGHLPLSKISRKEVQVMHVDIVEKQKRLC